MSFPSSDSRISYKDTIGGPPKTQVILLARQTILLREDATGDVLIISLRLFPLATQRGEKVSYIGWNAAKRSNWVSNVAQKEKQQHISYKIDFCESELQLFSELFLNREASVSSL